jgi:hypothetical protein
LAGEKDQKMTPNESEVPVAGTAAADPGSPDGTEPILYEFSGRNSLAQFVVWMILIHGAYLGLEPYKWRYGLFPVTCLVIIAGLRGSIVVKPSRVIITKKWLFIPYWRFTAAEIEDVWREADWDAREGDSMGIVVQLGKREVTLGSAKTVNQLLRALYPLTATARRYREPLAKPWSPAPASSQEERGRNPENACK